MSWWKEWLLCCALGASACVSSEVPTQSVPVALVSTDLTVVASTVPERVAPGARAALSITVRNTTGATWSAGSTRFETAPDSTLQRLDLTLARDVRRGQDGVFTATLTAPAQPGLHALSWRLVAAGATLGAASAAVEVTCSDGAFCNGMERWVNGRCQPSAPPCDDGVACTTDTCDEPAGACAHAAGAGCATCAAPNCNPSCHNRACGDDGCGGSCGLCAVGQSCLDGACAAVNTPGTCANPIPLLGPGEAVEGEHVVAGDTSAGINGTVPHCNLASTARDLVYTFTLTEPMGVDARVSGYDTVLSLRTRGCGDADPLMRTQPNWCSDDASPPGNYGSRIATMLPAGTYYVLVDGYNGQQQGPFSLSVRFVRDCVPQCDGKYCGDDGCGGSCGACGAGQQCSPTTARCAAVPCQANCRGRQCGDDGCGGSCGSCSKGRLCVEAEGACRSLAACDHLRPTCRTPCSRNEFCGSDCACHRLRDPLPDLVVDRDRLLSEIVINSALFSPRSCAAVEGCISGTGDRRLLRFTVAAVNQGQADLTAPPAADRPDLFEFGACHGHYHYSGFAQYELRNALGEVLIRGRKQAYCMEDSYQAHQGPLVGCEHRYTCEAQGIQAGWADVYGNDLDCQWIDITGLAPGVYQLAVTLNPTRTFEEVSFANNTTVVPVTVP